jgi:hypothetical protein
VVQMRLIPLVQTAMEKRRPLQDKSKLVSSDSGRQVLEGLVERDLAVRGLFRGRSVPPRRHSLAKERVAASATGRDGRVGTADLPAQPRTEL